MSTTIEARTPRRAPLRERLRYAFDNSMSAGPIALIGWLAVISSVIVLVGVLVIVVFGISPAGDATLSPIEAAWQTLMRSMDAGTVAGDEVWAFRLLGLAITFGGIFVFSTLVGVLTTGIDGKLEQLRKGRSAVVETGHTLILGWSPKVLTILSELGKANANVRRPRVVVMADRDKVEMEDEIRAHLGDALGRTKVICRSGNPLSLVDLAIANPAAAKSVVIVAPESPHPDRWVLRALLALTNGPHRPAGSNHLVATFEDPRAMEVARMIAPDDARLVNVGDLIARVMAQTCRQSGLSVVYRELLDFDGAEIYFAREPALAGRTFGDALLTYHSSAVIGIRRADGVVLVNPPMDTVFAPGDQVIAISEDDDTVVLASAPAAFDEEAIVDLADTAGVPERTLVLGWNDRGAPAITELDAYVADGSSVDVVVDRPEVVAEIEALGRGLASHALTVAVADGTDRAVLQALDLGDYDHVILLADARGDDRDEIDTRTLVSLLHLRDLATAHGHRYSIVTEVLDSANRELARVTSADDFIVSDELVSLLLTQISEHEALAAVLTGLFDADGSEIYLRPAERYVTTGREVTFATVVESARRRGEAAIGFRATADAADPERSYGVAVNPPKSLSRAFAPGDKVIVLAEG